MAIRTRFGSEVEIRYRCDDFEEMEEAGEAGCVHAFFTKDQNRHPYVSPTYEFRADGGWAEIEAAIAAARPAGCREQHSGISPTRPIDRMGSGRA